MPAQIKPVDQTGFGPVEGNCWAACLATILGVSIDDVDVGSGVANGWVERSRRWLGSRGYTMMLVNVGTEIEEVSENLSDISAPVIVAGPAERGCSHATVWVSGKMVHDPHPTRAGLLSVRDAYLLLPVDYTCMIRDES